MNTGFKVIFLIVFLVAIGSIGFYVYKTTTPPAKSVPCTSPTICPSASPEVQPTSQVIDPAKPYIKDAKVNYTIVGTVAKVEQASVGAKNLYVLRLTDDSGNAIVEQLTFAADTQVLAVASKSATPSKLTPQDLKPGMKVQVIASGDLKAGSTSNLAIVSVLVLSK